MLLRIPGGSGPWHVYWIQWWCCCLLDKRGFIEVPGVGASLEWAEEWTGDSEMDVVTHFFKGLGYKGGERQQVVGEECGVKGRFIFKMGNWCWNADGEETQEKGRWWDKWKLSLLSLSSLSPTSSYRESLFCSGAVLIIRHFFLTLNQNLSPCNFSLLVRVLPCGPFSTWQFPNGFSLLLHFSTSPK